MNSYSIPFFQQLRWRLTTIFVIVAVLPIILLAVIVLRQVGQQSQNQVFNQLESISVLKLQQINDWVKSGQEKLNLFASLPQVTAVLESPEQRSDFDTLLANSVETSSIIADVFVYTPDGTIITASNQNLLGRIVRRQPYFEHSLEGQHLQPPYFDISLGSLTMIGSTPVYIGDTLGGVIAIRYNIDELSRIMLERSGLGESGETYLVSRENNYLLTASRFDYPQNRAYNSMGINAGLNGETGQAIYGDYRSPAVPVFGVYYWIPELEAALLTEINEEEALKPLTQAQSIILVLTVVISTAVLGIGLFTTDKIARPIEEVSRTASEIAQGKLDRRVTVDRRDELGVLENAFNNMVQAVQDRTRELQSARDEALASQRIAQENSRLKSEFLSTMSHELRTPLNAIEGFTSIMLGGMGIDLDPTAEDMVRRVSANSKRLLQLVNDFLDLSRIEAGRLELVKTPLSPEKLARKWENQVDILAKEKELDFRVYIDPQLPPLLLGDEDALSKITINLLSNAFKFTHHGHVTLSLQRVDHQWSISVTDTGIGIPYHAREYIFEEFRQVDSSSKRLYGGTGLGLSLVQKISRIMQGSVTVQSELNKGSTFTVTIPLEVPETVKQGAVV